jgi:hypothetical protein
MSSSKKRKTSKSPESPSKKRKTLKINHGENITSLSHDLNPGDSYIIGMNPPSFSYLADAPPLPPDLIFAKFISKKTTRYNKIVSTEYIFNIGDDDNPNNVLLSDEDLLGPHNNLKVWKITDKPIPLWGKMNSFLYNAGNSKHRKSKKSKTRRIK